MSETDWKHHFMNMASGKARKKQRYYTLKQIAPTQQAVEMAKDQIKVIKARNTATSNQKRGGKVKKVGKGRQTKSKKSKTNTVRGRKKKSLVLNKGVKPDFFS